jgi:hypothetical protein
MTARRLSAHSACQRLGCILTRLGLGLMAVVLAGCAGVTQLGSALTGGGDALDVRFDATSSGAALLRAGKPIGLVLRQPLDARTGAAAADKRRLGRIGATVSDMHSTYLTLNQDIGQLVSHGLRAQFAADGFVLPVGAQAGDFEISTTIRAFELQISGSDEVNLVLDVSVHAPGSGTLIWSGQVQEKSSRYAGVMGNSRATVTAFMETSLSRLVAKVGASVRGALQQTFPQSVAVHTQVSQPAIAGVTTLTAPSVRETVPAPVLAPVAAKTAAAGSAAPSAVPQPTAPPAVTQTARMAQHPAPASTPMLAGYGYLSVITMPTRVKVYSDGIYYGLTPLKVMIPVGVMRFEFRFDGHATATEKISIRAGETTELELQLKPKK